MFVIGLAAGAFMAAAPVMAQEEQEEESPCESTCFADEEACFEGCADAEDVDACEAECTGAADGCIEGCSSD